MQRRTIWCCDGDVEAFTINLNAQHVSGMTHFDLALTWKLVTNTCTVTRCSRGEIIVEWRRERRVCEAGSKRNIYDFVLNYWCANIEFSPRNTLGLELLLPRSKASFSIWKSLMQRHIDYSNDQKPSNEHHHSNLAQITILHSFRYFPLVKVMLVSTKKNCQLARYLLLTADYFFPECKSWQ